VPKRFRSIDTSGRQEKNGGRQDLSVCRGAETPKTSYGGGNVRNRLQWQALGGVVLLGAGMVLAGCKSAPELTQDQAQALIQAKYDQTAPVGATIVVNDLGMREGATAKYWDRTKIYPNKIWADFKLTDDGKKVVKLSDGGDTIQWRPESADDAQYSITMTTVAANHLKARDVGNLQDEMVPGVDTAKGADFSEAVDLTGVPGPLSDIAHNPGNQLATKRHADFALVNGAWTLHGMQ
jgi:hypothetical protein